MSTTARARGASTAPSLWPLTAAAAAATRSVRAPADRTAAAARLRTCIICTAATMRSATGPRPRGAGCGGGRSRCDATDPVSCAVIELWRGVSVSVCVWHRVTVITLDCATPRPAGVCTTSPVLQCEQQPPDTQRALPSHCLCISCFYWSCFLGHSLVFSLLSD